MRCDWISILTAGLCISFVPACQPFLRPAPTSELPALPIAKPIEPAIASAAVETPPVPYHQDSMDVSVKPAASTETIIEPVHFPGAVTSPDLIPEPRSSAQAPAAAKRVSPPEQDAEGASPPKGKVEPAEEPPVLQALRCFLDKRPAEAVDWLRRYDPSSQDLLLTLLPLTVRLTERGWERSDSREASAVVEQLDRVTERVSASLRPRAKLSIKRMCFCKEVRGYGKFQPLPDSKGFLPGEQAIIYVELENLWDQRRGDTFRIHLRSFIEIRNFTGGPKGWGRELPDDGPDVSRSERHDFYLRYRFCVPADIQPGFYTLSLKIIDEPTRREVRGTLDFRVTAAERKGQQ